MDFGKLQCENKKKIDKYLDLARALKKTVGHEGSGGGTSCSFCAWNSLEKLGQKPRRTGHQSKNWDYPNHSIVKLG